MHIFSADTPNLQFYVIRQINTNTQLAEHLPITPPLLGLSSILLSDLSYAPSQFRNFTALSTALNCHLIVPPHRRLQSRRNTATSVNNHTSTMDSQPTAKAMHSGFAAPVTDQWNSGIDHYRPHQHRCLPAPPTI